VLGGLGGDFDVYDASPAQYRRDVVNDLSGWGSSFVKGISSVGRTINRAVSSVARGVTAVPKFTVKVLESPTYKKLTAIDPVSRHAISMAKIVVRGVSDPKSGWKTATSAIKSFTITPLIQTGMVLGIVRPPKVEQAEVGEEYQDADGNVITKEEYDRLMAASEASVPSKALDYKGYTIWVYNKPEGGVLYLINYDPVSNSCEGAYETMMETQSAIDAVSVPDVPAVLYATPASTSTPTTPVAAAAPTAAASVTAPTAAASTSGTVSFAQAYRGHAISTLTKSGGGVSYLIDVPQGSDGSGLTSYSTMPAAQAAIDAVTPQATVQPSYQQPAYEAPAPAASVYEPQQSPGLPVPQYTVQTPSAQEAPAYAAPVEAPAPANKTAGFVIGGGILAAAAALLLKR
jgi:hypothetical protein